MQTVSLETRLTQFAEDMRERAERIPAGDERNSFVKRAYNADQAIQLKRQLREHH
ncbi:hypothetical protein ACVWY3_003497 [Bradyrhizobium sp. USDA 4486]